MTPGSRGAVVTSDRVRARRLGGSVINAQWTYSLDLDGRQVELQEGEVAIGRSRGCQVSLRDASISRRHAILEIDAGKVILKDLGSSNGTYVNGRRVEGEQELSHGDRLTIGETDMALCVKPPFEDVGATIRLEAVKTVATERPAPSAPPMPSPRMPMSTAVEPPGKPAAPLAPPAISRTEIFRGELKPETTSSAPETVDDSGAGSELLSPIDNIDLSVPLTGVGLVPPTPPPAASPNLPPVAPTQPPVAAAAFGAAATGKPAGFWIRFAAYFVDALLIGAINFGVQVILSFVLDTATAISISSFLSMALGLGILFVGWTRFGTTPGKRLFNLWVCTADGKVGLTAGQAVLRIVGYMASSFTFMIGFLMIAFTKDKRGLHDMIASTWVARR